MNYYHFANYSTSELVILNLILFNLILLYFKNKPRHLNFLFGLLNFTPKRFDLFTDKMAKKIDHLLMVFASFILLSLA